MIDTCLLTMSTHDISQYCTELDKNKKDYADKFGFHYLHSHCKFYTYKHPAYSKVPFIWSGLERGFDRVIWVDMDVAFTNFNRNIEDLLEPDYWLATLNEGDWRFEVRSPKLKERNPFYLCAGLIVIKNCDESRRLVKDWISLIEKDSSNDLLGEQTIFNRLIRERYELGVRLCTEDEIGAFSEDGWFPRRSWRPGDLTIHLSAGDWYNRQALFVHKYLPQIQY